MVASHPQPDIRIPPLDGHFSQHGLGLSGEHHWTAGLPPRACSLTTIVGGVGPLHRRAMQRVVSRRGAGPVGAPWPLRCPQGLLCWTMAPAPSTFFGPDRSDWGAQALPGRASKGSVVSCWEGTPAGVQARDALEGGGGGHPSPLQGPAYAQPLSPERLVPVSMAFVTDSNRPQPLWQPPPTACLTASGAASEAPSLLMHLWSRVLVGAAGLIRAGDLEARRRPGPKDGLDRLTSAGAPPPPPPDQSDHRGKTQYTL